MNKINDSVINMATTLFKITAVLVFLGGAAAISVSEYYMSNPVIPAAAIMTYVGVIIIFKRNEASDIPELIASAYSGLAVLLGSSGFYLITDILSKV